MVHFVGAGSGAADLITVRGARLLGEADVVIYAGSLVNPAVLDYTCLLYTSFRGGQRTVHHQYSDGILLSRCGGRRRADL